MALNINGTERSYRAQILTSSATDTALSVDSRHERRILIPDNRRNHSNRPHRTMARTVTTSNALRSRQTIFTYPYGMTYLNGTFFGFVNRHNCPGRTHRGAIGAFRATISTLIAYFRLHECREFAGRAQHIVGTIGYTQP